MFPDNRSSAEEPMPSASLKEGLGYIKLYSILEFD